MVWFGHWRLPNCCRDYHHNLNEWHERCSMIEIIGLGTLCMLVWVLASSMASESDAEKRVPHRVPGLGCCTIVGYVGSGSPGKVFLIGH